MGSPAYSDGGPRADMHRQRRLAEPAYREELGWWDNVSDKTLIGRALLDSERADRPSEFILDLDGMSGRRYRKFINRLMHLVDDARYLEVGTWKGSTLLSAIEGNRGHACCIDNWSEYGSPRDEFAANLRKVQTGVALEIVDADFRSVRYSALNGRPFNVFLFDGPHNEQDHYDGIRLAQPALADRYTLIVDDWNWLGVRTGTLKALIDAGNRVEHAIEIRTTRDDSHPPSHLTRGKSEWHNGYFIAQCAKQGLKDDR